MGNFLILGCYIVVRNSFLWLYHESKLSYSKTAAKLFEICNRIIFQFILNLTKTLQHLYAKNVNASWALDVIFFHNALPQYAPTCVNHSKCAPFHNACHLFTCGFMIPNFSILLCSFKWCTNPIVPPFHYAPFPLCPLSH